MSKKTTRVQPDAEASSAVKRRVRYGLNVTLAVVAAVFITLLINYLVYTQYRSLSPDARQWVRYDLTSTRSYTLSPQTRGVLNAVTQPHRIISMLGGPGENPSQTQRVRDLIDEYARGSKLIEPEHLNLEADAQRRKNILAELAGLFADDTASIREALSQGLVDLDTVQDELSAIQAGLQRVIDAEVVTNRRDVEALYDLNSRYLLLAEQADNIRTARAKELGEQWASRLGKGVTEPAADGRDLPDYTLMLAMMQQYFVTVYQELLPQTDRVARNLLGRVNPTIDDTPGRREQVLAAQNDLATIPHIIRPTSNLDAGLLNQVLVMVRPLLAAQLPARYDDARVILSEQPCLIVRTPTQARVIPAGRLFRGSATDTVDPAGQTQEQFLGEEQLTGALISLTLDPPPLIVFVRSNLPKPALNYEQGEEYIAGEYGNSAARLRALGFEVTEWAIQKTPPRPRLNQRVVWITMPYVKPDPRQPATMDQTLKQKAFDHVTERLAAGDSAMVMLSFNPFVDPERADALNGAERGLANDPQINLLADWGIDAQVYQNVFYLLNEDDEGRSTQYAPSFAVSRWPGDAFVRASLTGITTWFRQAHPLTIEPVEGVKTQELVVLNEPGMFVQKLPPIVRPGQPIRPEAGTEREQIVLGVAAERGEARLITIGDAHWARDETTTYGRLPDGREGPGLANQPGATIAYPGNSELFVNSVYWLAHQEQLIAASPRTQEVRRIAQVTPATLTTYRWVLLGGMPGLIFAAGVAVWLVRRRA